MHSQVSGEKFLADEWRADGRPREIEELSDDFDNIGTLFIDYVMSALMREVRNKAAVGQVSRTRCPFGTITRTDRLSRRALALAVTSSVSRYRTHVNFGC